MEYSYIAGFFDGEGSAMILTIKRKREKSIFRFRPVVKIAQKRVNVLVAIKNKLGFGTICKPKNGVYNLQINSNVKVLKFIEKIAPCSLLKKKVLSLLEDFILLQNKFIKCTPYTRKQLIKMINIRDRIFKLNCLTRSKMKQKYPKEQILKEHRFIDIDKWNQKKGEGIKNFYANRFKKEYEFIRTNYEKRGGIWCAKKLNMNVSHIRRIAFRFGLNINKKLHQKISKIISENPDSTNIDIARKAGVCEHTIGRYKKRNGITNPKIKGAECNNLICIL